MKGEEKSARSIREHRYCPHCKGGIGECKGTVRASPNSRKKIRKYQCANCDKWWEVTIYERIIQIRYETDELDEEE